ncbi:MAG: aminopeptidase [Oscillospiraceae bacterium]|nr:aminopeptidase [Oscillospiraceae bacterium]
MDREKTKGQALAEQLLMKKRSCFEQLGADAEKKIEAYAADYMAFMDCSKTEREFVKSAAALLTKAGFAPFDPDKIYKAGDRLYWNNRGKSLMAAVVGAQGIAAGADIMAAHIDSPRLDLKPNPLYEDSELGYFKTHYYGGIKKYQWTAIPLALHGVVAKKDGSCVDVCIGEDEGDPVFCVTDILPHLSHKVQDERTTRDVIKGEELNVLIGSVPFDDSEVAERVKLNLMRLLHEKYGIVEADFNSAELEIVPAFKARYIGLDRSMIGAYGHDDKVCAYTALTALLDTPAPERTALLILADKEETGSDGNTGMHSDMLRSFLTLLCRRAGCDYETVCGKCKCLSADVNAALDPTFPEVHEKRNAAFLNYGPVITKYTGSAGKYGTNDASAEFIAEVRAKLDGKHVPWQTGELGKVDEGGGGTVAKFISALGIDVVDIGVAMLSMHAPFEIVTCADVYATHMAFCAFIQ